MSRIKDLSQTGRFPLGPIDLLLKEDGNASFSFQQSLLLLCSLITTLAPESRLRKPEGIYSPHPLRIQALPQGRIGTASKTTQDVDGAFGRTHEGKYGDRHGYIKKERKRERAKE